MRSTQEDVNVLIFSTYSKSRNRKNEFINTSTGFYCDSNEISYFAMQNISTYETEEDKADMIQYAINNMPFMLVSERLRVEQLRPIWLFFKHFFHYKNNQNVEIDTLLTEYQNVFGVSCEKIVRRNLKEWCTEMLHTHNIGKSIVKIIKKS
jgi:hypothetical protein